MHSTDLAMDDDYDGYWQYLSEAFRLFVSILSLSHHLPLKSLALRRELSLRATSNTPAEMAGLVCCIFDDILFYQCTNQNQDSEPFTL